MASLLDIKELPQDPTELQELVVTLFTENKELSEANAYLQQKLNKQLKQNFGRRSEKSAPGQLYLFADDLPKGAIAPLPEPEEEVTVKEHKRKGHGRRKIPAHIPRKVIEHALEGKDKACDCCGDPMEQFSKEVSERYEFIPSSFFVEQHERLKYKCKTCKNQFKTAPTVTSPWPKSLAGPGLMSQVLVSKFADHLPLERQSNIYRRHGVEFNPTTLGDWVRRCADLLKPIYEYMKKDALQSSVMWTDDTPVRVLDKKHADGVRQGRLWVYMGDENHPYNLFEYSPNRKGIHPQQFLKNYNGYLHADAYAGYDILYALGLIIEVACWAHARRKFWDAKDEDPARANKILSYLSKLFALEPKDRSHGWDPPKMKTIRQEKSKPILDALHPVLMTMQKEVLPKSELGQAITYTLNQWQALNRYLEDGRLHIDNNASENALRPIALGRKNWMFCGSDRGGRSGAVIASLISTCKRHSVNPWIYLHDALNVMAECKDGTMDYFTPLQWKKLRAEEEKSAAK